MNRQRWKFRWQTRDWARQPTPEDPLVLVLQMTPDIAAVLATGRFRALWWDGHGLPLGRPPVSRLQWKRTDTGQPPKTMPPGDLVPLSLQPVIAARLGHFVQKVVPTMIRATAQTDQVLDVYRPQAALVGMAWSPEVRAIAGRCRQRGVPVVGMQHGGSYGYLRHPGHDYFDLRRVDHWLAYGPGVVKALKASP